MTTPNNGSMIRQSLSQRIAAIIHAELSPLLTDALGHEHSWDAAESLASVIIESLELDKAEEA